jgi:predicted Ser/Thr protein kinase
MQLPHEKNISIVYSIHTIHIPKHALLHAKKTDVVLIDFHTRKKQEDGLECTVVLSYLQAVETIMGS